MATSPNAHSRNKAGLRHDLRTHLCSVAALAAQFARPFGGADAARLAGLWHDVGKFNPAWQAYLLASEATPSLYGHGPDHKAAGAHLAFLHLSPLALLVLCVYLDFDHFCAWIFFKLFGLYVVFLSG
jgi:CRISPR-associated endonuclease/helicase Cas3